MTAGPNHIIGREGATACLKREPIVDGINRKDIHTALHIHTEHVSGLFKVLRIGAPAWMFAAQGPTWRAIKADSVQVRNAEHVARERRGQKPCLFGPVSKALTNLATLQHPHVWNSQIAQYPRDAKSGRACTDDCNTEMVWETNVLLVNHGLRRSSCPTFLGADIVLNLGLGYFIRAARHGVLILSTGPDFRTTVKVTLRVACATRLHMLYYNIHFKPEFSMLGNCLTVDALSGFL